MLPLLLGQQGVSCFGGNCLVLGVTVHEQHRLKGDRTLIHNLLKQKNIVPLIALLELGSLLELFNELGRKFG